MTMLHLSENPLTGSFLKYGLFQQLWVSSNTESTLSYRDLVVSGILLAAGTWIVRGTLFLKSGGIVENFGRFELDSFAIQNYAKHLYLVFKKSFSWRSL